MIKVKVNADFWVIENSYYHYVTEWLTEHIPDSKDWNYVNCYSYMASPTDGYFNFRHVEDAVAFKLRFKI